MARVRGGNTGFAVALVIFGCGFVITLLVAIILYTKIETHKNAELAAQDELAKYVTSGQTSQAGDYMGDGTVFGNMLNKINRLEIELRQANEKLAQSDAIGKKMSSDFDAERTVKEQIEAQLAEARTQHEAEMAERKDQIENLLREKQAMVDTINALEQKVTIAIGSADEAAQQRIRELSGEIDSKNSELAQKRVDISSLNSTIAELRRRLPTTPEQNATLPDGKVASIIGEGKTNDLFITLGRRNGLVIGMTFEVFDPDPVIRLTDQGEARGKATVEVYSLQPESATCRVVRLERGEQITPGDAIVNIGYDPNMDISMYAFGTFDMEGDGGGNDIGRIETLIASSGAEVAELRMNEEGNPVLTPDLDFVVLGIKPIFPEPPTGPDQADPERIAEYQARLAEYEAYFRIVDDAKRIRIPVLNQKRFLDLIGYYER